MAKLVDALDLGPSNFCFESSSLSIRNLKLNIIILLKYDIILNKMILPFTLQQLRILKAVASEQSFTTSC